ncbi:unnamed protein product [Ostreobium quekettii]|uniref:START domain-containing protein n=1 Tax=Ostreobium quekettii TaxID=121088 RepID=A0A8S1ITQ0_9CHLO|nr:unnamed protein product [Ostreobium quekettii]
MNGAAGKGGMGGVTQGALALVGPALLVGLFAWLMLVDGWATGWPPTGAEDEGEGAAWSQKVRRLPRDLLLLALLAVLYLRSRVGGQGWAGLGPGGDTGASTGPPSRRSLSRDFEDLTEEEIRSVKHLSSGNDCVSALQLCNANHASRLREAVPNVFLLHLGQLLGEKSATKALQLLARGGEVGQPCALFGELQEKGPWESGWSRPVVKSQRGITFETTKRRWRNGLYLYKTTTILEDCSPAKFRAFNMDTASRKTWDWSMESWQRIEEPLDDDPNADSCFYLHEARMPGPICNRVYGCARRVWDNSDGGCYWITKSAVHPSIPNTKPGTVRVDEYTSGSVIRGARSRQGLSTPAVELSSVYFDDPKMRPLAFNLAMKSALWVAMQATERAFRQWLENNDVATEQELRTPGHPVRGLPESARNAGRRRKGRWRKVVRGVIFGGVAFVLHKVVK